MADSNDPSQVPPIMTASIIGTNRHTGTRYLLLDQSSVVSLGQIPRLDKQSDENIENADLRQALDKEDHDLSEVDRGDCSETKHVRRSPCEEAPLSKDANNFVDL